MGMVEGWDFVWRAYQLPWARKPDDTIVRLDLDNLVLVVRDETAHDGGGLIKPGEDNLLPQYALPAEEASVEHRPREALFDGFDEPPEGGTITPVMDEEDDGARPQSECVAFKGEDDFGWAPKAHTDPRPAEVSPPPEVHPVVRDRSKAKSLSLDHILTHF